ncbi:MAG: DNA repair protein RecO [Bacteroidales bacterium]
MNSETFKIIVLHTFKHKESGIILQGYTNRGGRESFFVKSGAKSLKKQPLSILHPLSIIEGVLSSRSFGELKTLKEFNSVHKLSSLRNSIPKAAIAIFISEIISKTIREIEQNREMFFFLEKSILDLEQIDEGAANFHLYFLVKYVALLGYMPEIPNISQGMLFDIYSAEYSKKQINRDLMFPQEESNLLWKLAHTEIDRLKEIKITGELRYRFLQEMIRYLSYHSDHEIKIGSLNILHEVFE